MSVEQYTVCDCYKLKILAGAGIYVLNSRYYQNEAVSNNALIVQQLSCDYNCRKFEFYCYSNSSSTNVGYIYYPNNVKYSSSSSSYYVTVSRMSPAGIYARNYDTRTPRYWGIYTCEMPDSQGSTLERNIGIYSSMPSR